MPTRLCARAASPASQAGPNAGCEHTITGAGSRGRGRKTGGRTSGHRARIFLLLTHNISDPIGTAMSDKVVKLETPSVHLAPSDHLTAAQAEIWRQTVNARAPDYFGQDAVPLLEEFCRVVVMCRVLAERIDTLTAKGEVEAIRALLEMRDRESKRLTSIATKLRITNQSRYTPLSAATAARKGNGGKVWEFGRKTGA